MKDARAIHYQRDNYALYRNIILCVNEKNLMTVEELMEEKIDGISLLQRSFSSTSCNINAHVPRLIKQMAFKIRDKNHPTVTSTSALLA